MINSFFLFSVVVGLFIMFRVGWWLFIELPRGHSKDEAICEKCWGKKMSDNVTESMEWCSCPQRETSDKHEKEPQ